MPLGPYYMEGFPKYDTNNANGKDKDYFYNFLAELSQKNLAKLK